ncbi:MAG TPA: magnesium transporter, partial [Methylophilaceae bacterium]|nr:magnesium transporter [Methylophilaceae bacterium]
MADLHEYKESLSENLMQVIALLEEYGFEEGQSQSHDYSRLQYKLDTLHPADVADILEALPLDQRLQVWELVKAERDGDILLEVSDAVRQSLIADMDSHELLAAAEQLDTDELA